MPEDLIQQLTNEFEQIRQGDCELNLELPMHLQIVQFTKEISFFVAIRIGFQNNNVNSFSSNLLERIQKFGRNSKVHGGPSTVRIRVFSPLPSGDTEFTAKPSKVIILKPRNGFKLVQMKKYRQNIGNIIMSHIFFQVILTLKVNWYSFSLMENL